jgi:hypothetical protein
MVKKMRGQKIAASHFGISGTQNFILNSDFWYHAIELTPSIRKKQVSAL